MIARFSYLVPRLVLLAACTAGDEANQADTTTAAPNVVTLTATDYAIETPDTIPAGWTTFHLVNDGATLHMAQLVRLEEGRTLEEFREAYEHAWRTVGPRPVWGKRVGGPGGAEPGATSNATMNLEPGSYGWYCPMDIEDGVPHVFGKGMARPMSVAPREDGAAAQVAPEPTITIRLLDYAFSLSEPLSAGRHVIEVENLGAEPHEVALLRLAPGKVLEDVHRWLQDFEGPPPGKALGGVSAVAHGAEAYFEAELTPGEYLLLCFVTAPDGRPHVAHGMIQQIRVE